MVCRIRPSTDSTCCVRQNGNALVVTKDKETVQSFEFDQVISAEGRQGEVFSHLIEPCVKDLMTGRNCCVLLFGPTG